MFVVTVAVSLLYVRSRFWMVELSYEMDQKRELKSKLLEEKRALTLELETLRSPRRIERIAQERLGLKKDPSAPSVIVLRQELAP